MITEDELIALASTSNEESNFIDFKREFSPEKKSSFWAETVKDIVAFANSDGGVIVFGLDDFGKNSGIDCSELFSFDSAKLIDQIKKYTNYNFQGISIVRVEREGVLYPAILIKSISVPLVFTKVGTYEVEDGKQKTAFSVGTIYFRHGSKSEPCTRDDIEHKIKAELDRQRDEWLGNIRKVVEAAPGSSVVITNPSQTIAAGAVRFTNDPNAPVARLSRLSDGYPHRQSKVIEEVNARLSGGLSINTHDIQTIKLFENITPENSPQYVHKPHETASPQYTDGFIDLICSRAHADPDYFKKCRKFWVDTKV